MTRSALQGVPDRHPIRLGGVEIDDAIQLTRGQTSEQIGNHFAAGVDDGNAVALVDVVQGHMHHAIGLALASSPEQVNMLQAYVLRDADPLGLAGAVADADGGAG